MFILDRQRRNDVVAAFRAYREYLATEAGRFPRNALALAMADWYFDANDHRSPHDAWLEEAAFLEPSSGARHQDRSTALRVRLLGGYHDKILEFEYPVVLAYTLQTPSAAQGLGDWRYDEFRVSDRGTLIHEIEWSGGGRWQIEAADVEFRVRDRLEVR
jgi:hypothetical protein